MDLHDLTDLSLDLLQQRQEVPEPTACSDTVGGEELHPVHFRMRHLLGGLSPTNDLILVERLQT